MRIETWTDDAGRRWAVHVPETRRERRRGLNAFEALPSGRGLFLRRCRSVHTFGMRFAIDVVGLDGQLIARRVTAVGPGRLVFPRQRVRHTLELPNGSAVEVGTRFRVDDGQSSTSDTVPSRRRITGRGARPGTEARTSDTARER